ncbi:GxxExxY protein [Echinicola jeungdonensis]|uniref:GxxExxY protein n=1 Tax=Echinicola jeungdonensis TaxID=709343 RepID=A0ABV5J2U8_9BACT|nr:GxxExxY protein [Echinicola jeungdonensis]MDN3668127.1 GxxExxY protein [Echinicola jeungdonensis]
MEDQLTKEVIGAAIDIHKELGPGLLESAYQTCLGYELRSKGLEVKRELKLPVVYKELELDQGYRIDLLVNNKLVIETKTVEALNDVHLAQILTYMKFGNYRTGLLLNFHVKRMVEGIKRVVL